MAYVTENVIGVNTSVLAESSIIVSTYIVESKLIKPVCLLTN